MNINSIEMEILGYMLQDYKNIVEVMPYLSKEYFLNNATKKLFDIIYNIYNCYDNITIGTLERSAKDLNINVDISSLYKKLINIGSKVNDIGEEIKMLKDNYVQYQSQIIYEKYNNLMKDHPDKIVQYSQKMNDELYELQNIKQEKQVELIGEGIHDFIESKKNINLEINNFIHTGFKAIDEKIVGIKKGEVLVIGGRPGSGKAQPLYSKILTPNGWVNIGDVKVGDEIINTYGGISKIDGVFSQGVMPIYEVLFDDGTTVRTTKDHLWFVERNGKDVVITLDEIMKEFDEVNFYVKNHSRINFNLFRKSGNIEEMYVKYDNIKSLRNLQNLDINDIIQIPNIQDNIENLAFKYNGRMNCINEEIANKVAFILRCCGYKVEVNSDNIVVSKSKRRIISIRYVENYEAQCISVTAINSLYITDNNIITHNTSFALNMMTNIAKEENNILFFSLEMKKDSLAERLLSAESYIPLKNIRSGEISDEDYEKLHLVGDKIKDLPIHLVKEYDISMDDIKNISYHYKSKFNIDVIVLDYLQLLSDSESSSYQSEHLRIKNIMREAKILANELDVVFIILSQLKRDVDDRENKRPRMSDLKESGSIEETADFIMFLYRDKYYDRNSPKGDICEIDIAKGRQTGSYLTTLEFVDYCTRFRDIEEKIVLE